MVPKMDWLGTNFPLGMSNIAVLVALSMSAYCFITHVIHVWQNKNWKNSPPGPVGWPILGNLSHLTNNVHEDLFELSKIYGPLFSLKLGFMHPVIAVSSPELAGKVLKEMETVFSNHVLTETFRIMSYDAVSIIFSPMGTRWRVLRRILTQEAFSPKALKAFEPIRQNQVYGVLKHFYSLSMSKKPVNISDWVFTTLSNIMSNFVCRKNLFDYTKQEGRDLKHKLSELVKLHGTGNIADFFPFLKPFDPQGLKRKVLKIFLVFDDLYEKLINERLKEREIDANSNTQMEKRDMLDILLQYRSDRDDELRILPRNIIKSLLSDMFIASTETNSSTVEWGMAEILRTPHAYKKIVMELDQVVGKDRFVRESDIANLPYFQAAVKEVFRLHPATPLVHRLAEEECEVLGYHIPKGCVALVNLWAISRDPSVWEEPWEFKPERFVGSSIDVKGQDYNLMPFGSGRRICVGWPLAHRMVHFYLAALLHAFEWECDPESLDNMKDRVGITLQKDKSVVAIPKPRLSTSIYM